MSATAGPLAAAGGERAPRPEFYAGAYERMNWAMLVTGAAAAPVLFWRFGLSLGVGYLLGAAVAFLNLYWLRRLVERFSELATRAPAKPPTKHMVAMFLLRYALVGLGAYAIFLNSLSALYGFFAGLVLPVAGVFCEAGFEIGHAWRR